MRVAKAVEAKGAKMLRAPVSGSTVLAAAGTLTILASGDKAAFDSGEGLRRHGTEDFPCGSRAMRPAISSSFST